MSRLTDEGQAPDNQHLATNVIHMVDTTDATDDPSGTSFKTTWQKAKDLFFGLLFFTEARSIAAPNATIPAHSLTATGAETNIDLIISPKGTGGIMADIPDNLAAGGNKRGTNSVDLQSTRTLADEVASGSQAIIIGGSRNKANGTQAIAGGNLNDASNTYAIALGNGNTASGQQAVAMGSNNTASGTGAQAIGTSNTAIGLASVAKGINNTATGRGSVAMGEKCETPCDNSVALGHYASTFATDGRFSWASGKFGANAGDIQLSLYLLSIRTTGVTQTTLVVDPGATTVPAANNQIVLENDQAVRITGKLLGKEQGTVNVCAWDVDIIIVRDLNAASTVLTYSNIQVVTNIPSWGTPVALADTTLGGLQFDVIGLAATDIQWLFRADTVETIFV